MSVYLEDAVGAEKTTEARTTETPAGKTWGGSGRGTGWLLTASVLKLQPSHGLWKLFDCWCCVRVCFCLSMLKSLCDSWGCRGHICAGLHVFLGSFWSRHRCRLFMCLLSHAAAHHVKVWNCEFSCWDVMRFAVSVLGGLGGRLCRESVLARLMKTMRFLIFLIPQRKAKLIFD